MEEDAAEIRNFESCIVPGLLQTPDYARKIIGVGNVQRPYSIKTLVDFRMSRQLLLSRPDPPHYVPIIAESVLYHQVGGDPAILRTQLGRLAEVAQLDHVELRVLPNMASEYLGLITSHLLLSLRPPGRLTVSVCDQLTRSIFVEDEDEVASHEDAFKLLLSAALSRTASLRLINEIASKT